MLTCARNRVEIGPARTPADSHLMAAGATSFVYAHDGHRIGVYVDDTTPDRDRIARLLHDTIPTEKVIVGLAPAEAGHRIPGCVCLLEWFAGWLAPPKAAGFILWWEYAPPGETKPSHLTRSRMLTRLADRRPQYLWVY